MTQLSCACGAVRLIAEREPILACECCCASCRVAAERMHKNAGAPNITTAAGATPFVLYRKDRIRVDAGEEQLAAFRLTPKSSTRRVLARCCSTPLFLEFEGGHWLSVYAALFHDETRPAPILRTMTRDLPDQTKLSNDIPNHRGHSVRFMWKLLSAWAAMGFRSPKLNVLATIDV